MHRGSPTGEFLLYNTEMANALNLGTQFSMPTVPSEPSVGRKGRRGWKVVLEVVVVLIVASALIGWFAVVRNRTGSDSSLLSKQELLRKMTERPAVSLTDTQKQSLLSAMVNSAATKTTSVTLTNAQRADLLKKMEAGK